MSQKVKRLAAVGLATISIVAAPTASLALIGGGTGVQLACQGSGGGCAG